MSLGNKETYILNWFKERVVVMKGKKQRYHRCSLWNTCSLVGVDDTLLNQVTIPKFSVANNILSMKNTISSAVGVAVNSKNPADLPKLISGLIKMSKADPLV